MEEFKDIFDELLEKLSKYTLAESAITNSINERNKYEENEHKKILKSYFLKEKKKFCRHCDTEVFLILNPKDYAKKKETYICTICNHKEFTNKKETCYCNNCRKEQKIYFENITKNKNDVILNIKNIFGFNNFMQKYNIKDPKNMPIIDIIKLSSFLSVFFDKKNDTILPYITSNPNADIKTHIDTNRKLTPSIGWDILIIKELLVKDYIEVYQMPESLCHESNEITEKYFRLKFKHNYDKNITWLLSGDIHEVLELLEKDNIDKTIEDLYSLWKRIVYEESLEFFKFQLYKVGLDENINNAGYSIIENFVAKLSPSDIAKVIYTAVTKGNRKQAERNLSEKKATDVAVDYLERYAERILSGEWSRNSFERTYALEQSYISKFFYNEVLKLDQIGFYTIPSRKIIKEQLFGESNNTINIIKEKPENNLEI